MTIRSRDKDKGELGRN